MQPSPEKDLLERRLARANSAREQAEQLLEEKSLALYEEAQRRVAQAIAELAQVLDERHAAVIEICVAVRAGHGRSARLTAADGAATAKIAIPYHELHARHHR